MTRVPRFALPFLACLVLVVPAGAAAAETPMSTSVADAAGDQNPGDLWEEFPGLRASTDLRRAVFATSSRTLTLTWTFADSPGHPRAFQTVGMSGTLKGRQMTFTAWRHDGAFYTFVGSGLGDDSKTYCQGQATVSLQPKKNRVAMKVPVSCLPSGKVIKAPYPTGNVTVLDKRGIVKGYVGSDSSVAAPDVAIRR